MLECNSIMKERGQNGPLENSQNRVTNNDLKVGGEQVISSFFRLTHPNLVRLGNSIVHNQAQAEDLALGAWEGFWKKFDTLKPDGNPFSYLATSVRHRATSHVRQENNRRGILESTVVPEWMRGEEKVIFSTNPEDTIIAKEESRVIKEMLSILTTRQRETFLLFHVQGLPQSEIATILGISKGAVKSHIFRAMDKLRPKIEEKKRKGVL